MTWDLLAQLAIAVVGIITAIIQSRRIRSGRRAAIKDDLEMLNALPAGSASRIPLQEHIDHRVKDLIAYEQKGRRDPTGMVGAIVLFGVGATLCAFAFRGGGLWWLLLIAGAPIIFIACFGFSIDAQRVERDEKGRPVATKKETKKETKEKP